MPIDFNNINFGGGRERGSSSEGNQPEETRGIKFNLLGGGKKSAQNRALDAAEALRIDELKAEDERIRQQGISFGRKKMSEIIQRGPARAVGDPGVDRGLPDEIKRIAKEDPWKAVESARVYIKTVQQHNQQQTMIFESTQQRIEKGTKKREELKERPTLAWGSSRSPDPNKKGFGKVFNVAGIVVSQGASIVGHSILSNINGTPESSGHQIEVTDRGLTTFAPKQDITSKTFDYNDWADNTVTTINPPKFLDKFYQSLANFRLIGRKRAEHILPIGTIEIVDRPGKIHYASAVTLFPGRKLAKIHKDMEDSIVPQLKLPQYVPVPDEAELLGPAAQELGLIKTDDSPLNGEIINP